MTKELEKNLFDIEPVNFLEDYVRYRRFIL